MCSNAIFNVAFLILLFLGIGHYNGVATALGIKQKKPTSYDSKYLNVFLGTLPVRVICFIVYFLPLLGFILAAASFKGWVIDRSWWQTFAFYSAILSLMAYVFYWKATSDLFNKIFSIVANVWIIVSILLLHWPKEIF